jgi:hypothetical protein
MFDKIIRIRRDMAGLATRLESCLDDAGPLAITRIGQLQWALSREVMRHAILIDRLAAERSPDKAVSDRARIFAVVRADHVLVKVQEHIHRWNAAAMIGDRAGHAEATRALLALLRRRMTLEERMLYPRLGLVPPLLVVRRRNPAPPPW